MGYILEINCRQCKKVQTFHLGQGMRDIRPETIPPLFEEPERGQVQKVLSDSREKLWNFRRVLGVCKECGSLSQLPCFTADIAGEDSAVCIVPKCRCAHMPEIIENPEKAGLTCPVCGDTLEIKVTGMWD